MRWIPCRGCPTHTSVAVAVELAAEWIAPGVVEDLNPWKDEEPCPHRGSTPKSCASGPLRWLWRPAGPWWRPPACRPKTAEGHPSRSGLAALPGPLRLQHHLQAGGRPGLDHLCPDHARGGGGPVPVRHRFPEGPVPFRIADMLTRAEPDLTAFAALPGALDQEPAAATPSNGLGRETWRRADVALGLPRQRVCHLSDRIRPVGAARGVAVRRTTLPLPDLTAPPDRHAPHRQQHRQHRRPPRPPVTPPDQNNTTPRDLTWGRPSNVQSGYGTMHSPCTRSPY